MAVALGRTWCVRHGHLRFVGGFLGSCNRAAMLKGNVRAWRQARPQPKLRYDRSLKCADTRLDSTYTECRRAKKRRIKLTLRKNLCVFIYIPSSRNEWREACGIWDGGRRESTGREWQREYVRRWGSIKLRRRGGHGERHQNGTRGSTTGAHTVR